MHILNNKTVFIQAVAMTTAYSWSVSVSEKKENNFILANFVSP